MNRVVWLWVFFVITGCQHQEIDASDLAELNGVFYERSTGRPYTGRVAGAVSGEMNEGLWQGRVATYHAGGAIQSEAHFQNGVMQGRTRSWYENGRLRSEASYLDGSPDGMLKQWFENGQLRSEKTYSKGMAHGAEREFSRDGLLLLERGWEAGRRHGLEVHYCLPNAGGRAPGTDSGMCSDAIRRDPEPVVLAGREGLVRKIWCYEHGQRRATEECAIQAHGNLPGHEQGPAR